eukprot:3773845-Prymnesium_polylepis.1
MGACVRVRQSGAQRAPAPRELPGGKKDLQLPADWWANGLWRVQTVSAVACSTERACMLMRFACDASV